MVVLLERWRRRAAGVVHGERFSHARRPADDGIAVVS
jgi:hypothetical protein